MIPLDPASIHKIWKAVEPFEFDTTHGGFPGQDIKRKDLKRQILESMKIWVKTAGWQDVGILKEEI